MQKPNIRASNMTSTLVIPRVLRAEVQAISDKTGESFGEIVRKLLTAHVEKEKELEAA
ncbi:hypothetical protein [Caballeronia sordidicola]|uniref:hypothetical protein n=1 Tax=Caballeronia sordidicola TaxID=196367 RepID=UPI0015C4FA2A|nr:hypothetical protein [Caballeronia sordidicola]